MIPKLYRQHSIFVATTVQLLLRIFLLALLVIGDDKVQSPLLEVEWICSAVSIVKVATRILVSGFQWRAHVVGARWDDRLALTRSEGTPSASPIKGGSKQLADSVRSSNACESLQFADGGEGCCVIILCRKPIQCTGYCRE
jgi:hypothetical protein